MIPIDSHLHSRVHAAEAVILMTENFGCIVLSRHQKVHSNLLLEQNVLYIRSTQMFMQKIDEQATPYSIASFAPHNTRQDNDTAKVERSYMHNSPDGFNIEEEIFLTELEEEIFVI